MFQLILFQVSENPNFLNTCTAAYTGGFKFGRRGFCLHGGTFYLRASASEHEDPAGMWITICAAWLRDLTEPAVSGILRGQKVIEDQSHRGHAEGDRGLLGSPGPHDTRWFCLYSCIKRVTL